MRRVVIDIVDLRVVGVVSHYYRRRGLDDVISSESVGLNEGVARLTLGLLLEAARRVRIIHGICNKPQRRR